eukprot:298092_1
MHSEVKSIASTSAGGEDDNNCIRVIARVRPVTGHEEKHSGGRRCVSVAPDSKTIDLASKHISKRFTFDHVYGEGSTQEDVFAHVGVSVCNAVLDGINASILAYGQTGSGKTWTMQGNSTNSTDLVTPDNLRGVVPRSLEFLFNSINKRQANSGGKLSFSCCCSFYEIFNEKVFDLLDPSASTLPSVNFPAVGLNIREDTSRGVYVEGLLEERVDTPVAAFNTLNRGYRNRHVGETLMNRESSRSHAVFTLVVEATEEDTDEKGNVLTRVRSSRFNLVDLAGSERQKSTNASGERLKEASTINGSLSTLGQVISALVEKSEGRDRHVAYRNSKLTFLLRESLGGNSRTTLVAAISPSDMNFAETLSTLKFAQRAKRIKNQAVVNEDINGTVDALKMELSLLRKQLQDAKGNCRRISIEGIIPHMPSAASDGGTEGARYKLKEASLLTEALKRTEAAEAKREAAERRVQSLVQQAEKFSKVSAQKSLMLKFRDSALAAQRKKDTDAERSSLAEHIQYLQNELEGGDNDSVEVVKWRTAYEETEAQLISLKAPFSRVNSQPTTSGSSTMPMIWTPADEELFNKELGVEFIALSNEVECLRDELEEAKKRVEEEMRSAAQAQADQKKCIVEDALLSKLHESNKCLEEARSYLQLAEANLADSEASRAKLLTKVESLDNAIVEEKKRSKAASDMRDCQLASLQAQIQGLTEDKENDGTEVSQLREKLATAIKDSSILLQRAREAAADADEMEDELERVKAESEKFQNELSAEKSKMAQVTTEFEATIAQRVEVHEREIQEQAEDRRALEGDFDALHAQYVEERKNAMEAAAQAQCKIDDLEVELADRESLLVAMNDDHEVLTGEIAFSSCRIEDLLAELGREKANTKEASHCLEVAEEKSSGLEVQVSSVTVELESQKALLQKANEKASVLEENLSTVNDRLAVQTSQLSSAEAKSNSLSSALDNCRDELQVTIERSCALEADLGSSNVELVESKMNIQALNEKCSSLEILISELSAKLKAEDGRADRLGNALTSTSGKFANVMVKYNSLQRKNAEEEINVNKYVVELAERTATLTALQQKISESQTQLEASDARYADVTSELETYQSKTSALVSEIEVLKNENTMVQTDLFNETNKFEMVKLKETKIQLDLDEFSAQITELQQKVEELQTQREVSDARISDLTYESDTNASEVKKMQGIVGSSKAKLLNQETLLCEASVRSCNLEKQLSNEMAKYESKLKIADNKSLELQDELTELDSLLKDEKKKIDAVSVDLHDARSRETELVSLVADYKSQLQTSESHVVELKSMLDEKTALCTDLSASFNVSSARVEELDNDLHDARSRETELVSLVADYKLQLQTSESHVVELKSMLDEKTALYTDLSTSFNVSSARVEELDNDLHDARSRETGLVSLVADYKLQLQTSESHVVELKSMLDEKTALYTDLSTSFNVSSARVEELESLKEEKSKHLSQLEVSLEGAQGQLMEVNRELVDVKAKAQSQLSDFEDQLAIAQSDVEKLTLALEKAKNEPSQLKSELTISEEARTKLVIEIGKLNENMLSNAKKSVNELSKLMAETKSNAEIAAIELSELNARMTLDSEKSANELIELREKMEHDAEKATAETNELRSRITSDTEKANRTLQQMEEDIKAKERVLGQMLADLDTMQRVAASYATERKQLNWSWKKVHRGRNL